MWARPSQCAIRQAQRSLTRFTPPAKHSPVIASVRRCGAPLRRGARRHRRCAETDARQRFPPTRAGSQHFSASLLLLHALVTAALQLCAAVRAEAVSCAQHTRMRHRLCTNAMHTQHALVASAACRWRRGARTGGDGINALLQALHVPAAAAAEGLRAAWRHGQGSAKRAQCVRRSGR
jgi:hypothetical protein